MDKTETKKIIASMIAAYPNYKPTSIDLTVSVWMDTLDGYSYSEASTALKAYMRTNNSGFAPSPGQLIEQIHTISRPQRLNEQEAWSLVANALRRGTYHSVEEFAKLPPEAQRAVGQPSQLEHWATDENFNEEVAKASFQRSYRAEVQRSEEVDKLPEQMQIAIQNSQKCTPQAEIQAKNDSLIKSLSKSENGLNRRQIIAKNEYTQVPERLRDAFNKIGKPKEREVNNGKQRNRPDKP